jgi:hypothetical protein
MKRAAEYQYANEEKPLGDDTTLERPSMAGKMWPSLNRRKKLSNVQLSAVKRVVSF